MKHVVESVPRRTVVLALAAGLAAACGTAPPSTPAAGSAQGRWNMPALAEAIAYVASVNSTAFLIVQDGRVVAEHRWPLPANAGEFRARFTHGLSARGDLLEDVASLQKSVVAILVGIAIDRRQISSDAPVSTYLGPGWSKATPDQEAAIMVRHLLEMSSGLNDRFAYEAPAGTRFYYNTPVYATLKPLLEKATGQDLATLTREGLTAPLGMSDTSWRARPAELAGSAGNATGLVTTAPDLAKLGRFVLDQGRAPDGRRLLSDAQFKRMFVPTTTNPAYGELWWLNGGSFSVGAGPAARRSEGPLIASAPADLLAAQGAQDRKLYVVPSRNLIVIRMGQQVGAGDFNDELWKRLSRALPSK